MQRLGDVRAPISCHKSRWTYHRGSCSELKYFKGVEEWKTNLMSLANFFFFTSYVLNMFRTLIYPSSGACDCIVDLPHRSSCSQFAVCWSFGAAGFGWCSFWRLKYNLCFSLQNEHHPKPTAPKLQHTANWEQDDRCGKSTTQSQAPDDGYINVRNMLSTQEVKKKQQVTSSWSFILQLLQWCTVQ